VIDGVVAVVPGWESWIAWLGGGYTGNDRRVIFFSFPRKLSQLSERQLRLNLI
jgi:hypothetical protein